MSSIKLDRAYCYEAGQYLTIYEVQDLHFDETIDFDGRKSSYKCPDADCPARLVGVNHTKDLFKMKPHFRLLKGHAHIAACDYGGGVKTKRAGGSPKKGTERKYKASYYPAVFLLERQKPIFGTGESEKKRSAASSSSLDRSPSNGGGKNTTPHETSCLEHLVYTWETKIKEFPKKPLKIGKKDKTYGTAFKYIKYFTDEKGLVYWGYVSIKKYGENYSIYFKDSIRYEGEDRRDLKVSIYITKELIEGYRKRKHFRNKIEALAVQPSSEQAAGGLRCYFVGAYPKLAEKEITFPDGKSIWPLDVHLKNLDHLDLRSDYGGKDLKRYFSSVGKKNLKTKQTPEIL